MGDQPPTLSNPNMADNYRIDTLTAKLIARAERNRMTSDNEEALELYLNRVRQLLAAAPDLSGESEKKKMILTCGLSGKFTSLVLNRCTAMSCEQTLAFLENFCGKGPEQAAVEFRSLRQGSRPIAEWRLAVELVGTKGKRTNSDIIWCFIDGITDTTLRQELMRANAAGNYNSLEDLMPVVMKIASTLTSTRKQEAAATTTEEENVNAVRPPGQPAAGPRQTETRSCYNCGERGHIAKFCPKPKQTAKQAAQANSNGQMKCQLCDGIGHEARQCGPTKPYLRCQWCNIVGHSAKECNKRLKGNVNVVNEKSEPLNEQRDQ